MKENPKKAWGYGKADSEDELTEKIDGMAEAGEAIDERMRALAQGQDPAEVETVQPATEQQTEAQSF